MQNPKQEVRKPNEGYCGDAVYGDNWVGPTRSREAVRYFHNFFMIHEKIM